MKKSTILSEIPLTRRTVIAGATLIPLAALTSAPPLGAQVSSAQAPATQVPAAVFSAEQRRILDAFIDRLIPKDEIGPGAVECGVGDYIDRCLADFLAAEKPAFLEGLAGLDLYALRTQGTAFASLTAESRRHGSPAIGRHPQAVRGTTSPSR